MSTPRQLLSALFTATLASNKISPKPATSFQVHFGILIYLFGFIPIFRIWVFPFFTNLLSAICDLIFLFFSLLVLRSLGCSRMWRNKYKSHFPWGSENKWTWRIQSPSTFLGIQTCQENQAMFSEANQQQRAVLFHTLNGNNFIFTPSEIKNQRNSHFLGWFFHIQASKTANTV